jgi:CheY-like chemotaxis protein
MIEQVLEPFFTTKEVGKGTGLGLSMVYGFAQQSGGGMSIKSRLGKGTRVEIWLPRAPEAASSPAKELKAPAAASDDSGARGIKVLLVDDHESVRTTTAALLVDLGYEVVEASDGGQAIALLEKDPDRFDLLVTDYAMPLMSGTEVIEKARQIRPELPALIITGYADEQSIARRPEGVQVIAKPFGADQMRLAIGVTLAAADALPKVLVEPLGAQA